MGVDRRVFRDIPKSSDLELCTTSVRFSDNADRVLLEVGSVQCSTACFRVVVIEELFRESERKPSLRCMLERTW
jgi:hypothetical protein